MRRVRRTSEHPFSPTRRQMLAGVGALALGALPAVASVPRDPDIIVIGAGAAGLAATRGLMEMGISVACIEAQNRIGGRAYTEHETFAAPYDRGCHWLTSAHVNPWIEFGRTNG
jgi:monoamine oxidase